MNHFSDLFVSFIVFYFHLQFNMIVRFLLVLTHCINLCSQLLSLSLQGGQNLEGIQQLIKVLYFPSFHALHKFFHKIMT